MKDPGLPSKCNPSLPVIFATAPSGARLPYRIARWLSGFDRVVEIPNDILTLSDSRDFRKILCQCLSRHRHAVAVQHAFVQHAFHQRLNATNLDEFRHQVLATGLNIGQHRCFRADTGEVIQRQLDVCFASDRQKMQYGIRRAAQRDNNRYRIFEMPLSS